MPALAEKSELGTGAEALLTEIRQRFDGAVVEWQDAHDEAVTDMRYAMGDPWLPAERERRKNADRPCLTCDEMNQYLNQAVNSIRQNPRGIVVEPEGQGATPETAELHQGIIRGIEYKSRAKQVYADAYQDAIMRGYGFYRISRPYEGPKSFNHKLEIRPIPNPDTVYLDPAFKRPDASDMRYAFILDEFSESEFRERWPRAEIQSFSSEHMAQVPKWIKDKRVQVAEYWVVKMEPRTLLLLGDEAGTTVFEDEIAELGGTVSGKTLMLNGMVVPIVNQRQSEKRVVCQYITNGLEILEKNEWPSQWIPIIPVFGKILYVPDGSGGTKRTLVSMIRMARDPYMLYCYYRTQQAEFAGMIPKSPWVGYEGQFEGFEDQWENAHRSPIGYLQAKPMVDGATGQTLPLPTRPQWDAAPLVTMDQAAESARRAIQAAMGMYDSSVGKRDPGAKSGVALRELDRQSQQGNYHFVDHLDNALEHGGRILEELIPIDYDTARDIAIVKPDETRKVERINDPAAGGMRTDLGEHGVTISTGPSYASQVEETREFIKSMLSSNLPQAQLLLDLFIKLSHLGPLGEEMADRVRPPQFEKDGQPSVPQLMAAMDQMKQHLEALNAFGAKMQAENEELKTGLEKQRMADASRERIAAGNQEVQLIDTLLKTFLDEFKTEAQATLNQLNAQQAAQVVPE